MAFLINEQSGDRIYLNRHHTFGRREDAVDTQLHLAGISKIHAVIEFRDDHWCLRDISKNGTWIDRERVDNGLPVRLKAKQQIAFAGQLDDSWLVENLQPPADLLIPVLSKNQSNDLNKSLNTQEIRLEPYNVLPDEQQPKKILFLDNDIGAWILEDCDTGKRQEIEHGQQISMGLGEHRHIWQLHTPPMLNQTEELFFDLDQLQQFIFEFHLSQDEETTSLKLVSEKRTIDLGERSHHYLLLHLARQKFDALNKGYEDSDVGWIDKENLARDLGIDAAHLNILIFRSRKQIGECLPFTIGVNQLLERRRGYIRIGNISFNIYKSSQMISTFDAAPA
ncbi:Uncharacterised protein [BD1-7 clade bacterium]|uniref:FHA domain-containing protein n=1 Tax=BD1-7 clade bacterium TaxID=2029982 RepID=A0A5S9QH65_9GAMM|nr:Uncharacterised protein [BD1-7 clade bacterium]CAA0117493.1 Uncharacterised protein [BD1-7 clade bacterium]